MCGASNGPVRKAISSLRNASAWRKATSSCRIAWRACEITFITWDRALPWYSSPARPFAAPDVPLLVTGQQGSLSPACRQLFRVPNACAESSREESTKLGHGTQLGRTLCYNIDTGASLRENSCGTTQAHLFGHRRRALAALLLVLDNEELKSKRTKGGSGRARGSDIRRVDGSECDCQTTSLVTS